MVDENDLYFYSRLYQCWPWYLDHKSREEIHHQIIENQQKEIKSLKKTLSKRSIKVEKKKKKSSRRRMSFLTLVSSSLNHGD